MVRACVRAATVADVGVLSLALSTPFAINDVASLCFCLLPVLCAVWRRRYDVGPALQGSSGLPHDPALSGQQTAVNLSVATSISCLASMHTAGTTHMLAAVARYALFCFWRFSLFLLMHVMLSLCWYRCSVQFPRTVCRSWAVFSLEPVVGMKQSLLSGREQPLFSCGDLCAQTLLRGGRGTQARGPSVRPFPSSSIHRSSVQSIHIHPSTIAHDDDAITGLVAFSSLARSLPFSRFSTTNTCKINSLLCNLAPLFIINVVKY